MRTDQRKPSATLRWAPNPYSERRGECRSNAAGCGGLTLPPHQFSNTNSQKRKESAQFPPTLKGFGSLAHTIMDCRDKEVADEEA